MGFAEQTVQRAQELSQSSTGRSLDALAFIGGIAVWQEWLPVVVGIFTCLWLGAQLFMALPKMAGTWKWIKEVFTKKRS